MVLGHYYESVCKPLKVCLVVSTNQKLIIFPIYPIWKFREEKFGVKVYASLFPQNHPSPKVSFIAPWSQISVSSVRAVNTYFFPLFRNSLDAFICHFIVKVVKLCFFWKDLGLLWKFWRFVWPKCKYLVRDSLGRNIALLNYFFPNFII